MSREDPKGFAVDVGELDKIASVYLPQAADALRAPISVITAHEGLEGPGRLTAMFPMEDEYSAFTQSIGNQQRLAVNVSTRRSRRFGRLFSYTVGLTGQR